jgi:long-chain fatty acid transport protein
MDLIVLPMLSCIPSLDGLRLNMSTSHALPPRLLHRLPGLPLAAVAAVAALVLPGTARASGFLTDQFGADHGQPALGNPYSVYFNPAAMAGMAGSDVVLDGVVAAHDEQFNRTAPLSPSAGNNQGNPAYAETNTGQASLFNVLAAPFIGFVTDFGGSKFRLGVASYIPFGGQLSWQKNIAYGGASSIDPGAYDGPQRWASISASTSSIYETVALAYRFDKARLGVGVNFSVIRTGLTDVRARNTDGSDDILGPTGQLKEGRAYVNMSGVEVGAAAGVYWEPLRDGSLRLGASYTSAPNFGTMRLNGTFELAQGSQTTAISNPADLLQAYPDLIRFGGAWRISPQAELRLDGTWQRWSQFNYQCIVNSGQSCDANSKGVSQATSGVLLDLPRNWNDSVKLRLGIATWINPETELWASFAWESSPVANKYQDPLLFDSTRLEGTAGVRRAFGRHLYASLAYTYVYYLPVTVTDSAYGSYGGLSQSPNENGRYTSELFIFDGAVGYRF